MTHRRHYRLTQLLVAVAISVVGLAVAARRVAGALCPCQHTP